MPIFWVRGLSKITTHDIKNGYNKFYENKFAQNDDWTSESVIWHPRRWICSLAEKERGRCLVVGCGIVDLKIFQANKKTAVGIDISNVALKKVKEFGEVVLADVTYLPFRFSSFNSVCAFDVLEHVPNKTKMMTEIRRTLRNGGKIFLSVPIKVGDSIGDKRQPYDEPPTLIFLISLVKKTYTLSVIRGFWGRNPFNYVSPRLFPFPSFLFKYFPYFLMGSGYVSLVATKSG